MNAPLVAAASIAHIHSPDAKSAVATVRLRPVPRLPGLYEAHFTPTRPGTYRVATPHPAGRSEDLSTTIRVSAARSD